MTDPIFLGEPHVVNTGCEAIGTFEGQVVVPLKYLNELDCYMCRSYRDWGDGTIRDHAYYIDDLDLSYLESYQYEDYLKT